MSGTIKGCECDAWLFGGSLQNRMQSYPRTPSPPIEANRVSKNSSRGRVALWRRRQAMIAKKRNGPARKASCGIEGPPGDHAAAVAIARPTSPAAAIVETAMVPQASRLMRPPGISPVYPITPLTTVRWTREESCKRTRSRRSSAQYSGC